MPRPAIAPDSLPAVAAIAALFAINGIVIGGFGGVLPALRERLGIDAAALSVLLIAVGVAAVASMQVGGRLADRRGARGVALASMPLMSVGALVMAFAPTFPVAIAGGVLVGLGNGAMDVAMNALGVQVEQVRPTPMMSRFHAFWSLGSFVGAALVVLLARVVGPGSGSVVTPALVTVAVLALLALVGTARFTPDAVPVSHDVDGVRARIPPVAWLLGAMAVCFGLTEGTAADWSSIHVTDVTGVDPGVGAIGLVCVSGFMVLVRLAGDAAVARFGRRGVVRWGAVASVVGYAVTVGTSALPVVLVGWSLVGLGVGMIAPQIYAAAGHLGGGRMLAVVVTFGYAAFLTGPALIGWLVHTVGIQHAMVLPLVLAAGLVVLAGWLPAAGQKVR